MAVSYPTSHSQNTPNKQSVVGIDLGNLSSKIGVARHRGIDIIANEVSNRATP
jgi:molecular chaperone DnaK (HSP70)